MLTDMIARDMAATVRKAIDEALSGVLRGYEEKLARLEKALADTEKPPAQSDVEGWAKAAAQAVLDTLPPPQKGEDGKSVTLEDVKPILEDMVKAIEIPVPDIAPLESRIEAAIKAIPEPKDGKDGESVTAKEVAEEMEGHFAKWALDFERKADLVLQKAVDKLRQPEDGKDGRDAFPLEDFAINLSEDGRTVEISLGAGEKMIQRSLKIPAILDRGVYRKEHAYERGDGVTYGGSFWIAQKDAPEGVPGGSEDWRLAVKRGRDGRESVKIERSKPTVKLEGENAPAS